MRQALATEFFGRRQRAPTRFTIFVVRCLEALGRRHAGVIMSFAALQITDLVEREEYFLNELCALAKNRVDHVAAGVFETGQVGEAIDADDIVEDEARIFDGRGIAGH